MGRLSRPATTGRRHVTYVYNSLKNGEDKTQHNIAKAANVTEVTIRNRYKGLKESLNL